MNWIKVYTCINAHNNLGHRLAWQSHSKMESSPQEQVRLLSHESGYWVPPLHHLMAFINRMSMYVHVVWLCCILSCIVFAFVNLVVVIICCPNCCLDCCYVYVAVAYIDYWCLLFVVVCCFSWQGLCQCCLCCFELSLCCLYYVVCICVALVHAVSSDKVYVSTVWLILVCVVCCDKVYFDFLCCCWSVLSYWLSLFWCCLLHFGLCCLNWLNLCCCLCKLSLSIVLIRTLLFLLFVISVNVVRNYKV